MTSSSVTNCARCGALLPAGAGTAGSLCPACGQPLDPAATWRPAPGPAMVVEMPPRLPLTALALLGIFCALMGLGLGMWLGWGRNGLAPRAAEPLPALPPLGQPAMRSLPAPQNYRAPAAAAPSFTLPPARVTPPGFGWQAAVRGRESEAVTRRAGDMRLLPAASAGGASSHRPAAPAPSRPPTAPLRADGMATVRVDNPSAAAVDVSLSGRDGPIGVVGPRASIDFILPPGRYDIALRGPARTQRIYDAPLHAGDVLSLVYSAPPAR